MALLVLRMVPVHLVLELVHEVLVVCSLHRTRGTVKHHLLLQVGVALTRAKHLHITVLFIYFCPVILCTTRSLHHFVDLITEQFLLTEHLLHRRLASLLMRDLRACRYAWRLLNMAARRRPLHRLRARLSLPLDLQGSIQIAASVQVRAQDHQVGDAGLVLRGAVLLLAGRQVLRVRAGLRGVVVVGLGAPHHHCVIGLLGHGRGLRADRFLLHLVLQRDHLHVFGVRGCDFGFGGRDGLLRL